jgi:alkanesulfonate monooxygenase SsuD/methylene tetrahydromethanopterin reductase-like flavin-dependent oxidoreductase (luciferase family)
MVRGARVHMKPPIDDIDTYWTQAEKAQVQRMLACAFAGSPATLRGQLQDFIARTGCDELMVATAMFDHAARLRSYELLAGV